MENQAKVLASEKIENAMADLEIVKSLIMPGASARASRAAVASELKMVGFLLAACCVFLVWELAGGRIVTNAILVSENDRGEQAIGLAWIAGALGLIAGGVYFLAWRRAREMSARLGRTLSHDFPYLAARAFLPDLAAKFSVLSIVVLADRPALVGPILIAYVADYAFQGRFFDLPSIARIAVGVAGLGFAVQTALSGDPGVLRALVFFAAVAAASCARSLSRLAAR